MRITSLSLLLSGLMLISSGCNNSQPDDAAGHTDPPAADVHAHPSEGPHHGALVELGNEEYHAEVVHGANSVTVYVLDSSAKVAVPIEATEVTINILHDGAPEQFSLTASPLQGEAAGMSSRFVLADAELAAHLGEEAAAPKLSLTIAGSPYRGDIHIMEEHDHDHDH